MLRCSANDVVPVKPVSFALDMYVGQLLREILAEYENELEESE